MTTAKHGTIPTERETEEGGIMEDGTNKQRRALGGGKKERIRTVVDDRDANRQLAFLKPCRAI